MSWLAPSVGAPQPVEVHRIVSRQLQVIGSYGAMAGAYWGAMEFMWRHSERFDWDRMFGGEYGLGEVTVALSRLHSMRESKPIINPSLALTAAPKAAGVVA